MIILLSFCEEDYAVSAYLTEFINSLTNLAYVYYALRYMYGPGSRGLFAPKVDFMAVSLLLLGIGSFLFHASMRQTMQFADELAMLGLTWSLLLGALNIQRTSAYNKLVSVGLAVIFPLFSAFYIWTANILYHSIAFGTILTLIVLRGHYLFHWRVPAFPADKCHTPRTQETPPCGPYTVVFAVMVCNVLNVKSTCMNPKYPDLIS
ncbi:alkaline ceramidase ydc1 [Sporothrix stenoceras]|uniref:Alkaline ceramidase ydc1 n=1 Tax=Sporothrix stenoceras TaxID=5173 RepID=A0ABR3YQF6_9PEZI